MTRYQPEDMRGVIGILPTPSLPGADRWDAVDTVNLDESERMTNALIEAGVDVILTNGTFGEGASLTLDEILAFNDVVIRTAAGRVPIFCGATTLNTRDTIDRSRRLTALGADGLFLGRPMWVALDDVQIVEYHRAVAEALPDQAQILYDNPSAFKGKISAEAYAQLAGIDQIVAAKHMGMTLMGERFADDLRAVNGRMRLLVLADDWLPSALRFPDEVVACWTGEAACGPAPLIRLRDAVLAGDWERARVIHDDIHHALEPLMPNGDFAVFSGYNIQIDRAEFEAAGWITPGPARPPYTSCPEDFLEGGRLTGRRWAELQRRYSPQHSSL